MKSVFFYGSETWRTPYKLRTFVKQTSAQNPLYLVAREDERRGSVQGSRPGNSGLTDPLKKVGLDWPHLQEANQQHHQAGCDVESTGEKKEGKTQGHMVQRHGDRNAV